MPMNYTLSVHATMIIHLVCSQYFGRVFLLKGRDKPYFPVNANLLMRGSYGGSDLTRTPYDVSWGDSYWRK